MATPLGGIDRLNPAPLPMTAPQAAPSFSAGERTQFQNLLVETLEQAGALEQAGQAAIEQSLAGGDITQVEVFSAVKKADLALRMLLQMRNKMLEAYNEIKQMQM